MKKYDIGIFGVWSGCNYGSIATYYALNKVISSMGKSVLMIDKPVLFEDDVELKNTHSRRFANEHYDISNQYRLDEFEKVNDLCDGFVMGSDQIWNYGISKNFGKRYYLDFADDSKVKVAYAASFGHSVDFAPADERKEISSLMNRFDGISVRESDGVTICHDDYGVEATHVLDPVFLADKKIFDELVDKSSSKETEPFIATYILDPTPEKREAILHVAEKLGNIKIINLLDGLPWKFEENRKRLDLPNCIENLQVEDWLYYLKNAEFVITDSCHGASFALIFERNFIAIGNKRRGMSRFSSLINLFHVDNKFTTEAKDILVDNSLLEPIDYSEINSILKTEKERCYNWLYEMINKKNPNNSYTFEFDDNYWEQHVVLGKRLLITKKENSEGGKYAVLYLNQNFEAGQRYVLKIKYKLSTSSPSFNLHLMKRDTKQIQIIYTHRVNSLNTGKWIELETEFVPDYEDMNSFMVGAMQLSGEDRYFLIEYIKVERKCDTNE